MNVPTVDPKPYLKYLETLTLERVPQIKDLVTSDVRFRDPFNDVTGVERITRVFAKIFHDCTEPRFKVTDKAPSAGTWYIRWTFTATMRRSGQPVSFDGVSELRFAESGRVSAHIDHWDAGQVVYAKIPIVGAVVRAVRKTLSAGD